MRESWPDRAWLVTVPLLATAVALVTAGGATSPARLALTVGFLLVCPGMPWVRLLRPGDEIVALMLAIALSLAFEIIVAAAVMYAGHWDPSVLLVVYIDTGLAGTAVHFAIVFRPDRGTGAEIGRTR